MMISPGGPTNAVEATASQHEFDCAAQSLVRPQADLCVFGFSFWNPSYPDFKRWWTELLGGSKRESVHVALTNAHTLNTAWVNEEFRQAFGAADVRINDGIGFRLAARMRGVGIAYNFNGTDLLPKLLSELERPITVFLYGATEESNRMAAERIRAFYPLAEVVGRINGYVDPETEAVPAIATAAPDLLLVAMGHPRQELFVFKYREHLQTKIVCPVGALFDFLSGSSPRAPGPLRRASLEWVYRLWVEPRRMFSRYVIGNPLFLARSVRALRGDLAAMKSETT